MTDTIYAHEQTFFYFSVLYLLTLLTDVCILSLLIKRVGINVRAFSVELSEINTESFFACCLDNSCHLQE